MRLWNIRTFYGSYGKIEEHNGQYHMEIIWNGYVPAEPYRKTYKTLRGAKIALGKMCDCYTLTEYR